MRARIASPRRERILASAEKEFASHGNTGARMERIAAAAAVNKQLLFHYFGSKAGLYQAVSKSVEARLDVTDEHGSTPAERLRKLAALLLAAANEYRTLLSEAWKQRAATRAAQILRDGQRQGYFRDDIDPEALAELVAAASLGWAAVGERDQAAGDSGNREQFGDLVATVITDYCTWR